MTTPERARRCLRLVAPSGYLTPKPPFQCANEQLPGSELCAHHLAEAASDFRRLTGQADHGTD